jgi:hypothetical protein
VVEIVSVWDVPAFRIDCRSVLVATPLIVVVSTVPEAESAFEVMMLEVETAPATSEVSVLPRAEIRFDTVVVATTPLILVVMIPVAAVTLFDETTDEVAITPLIVVVRVLPASDWVKELIMLARPEVIPFTITSNTFADEEATFVLIVVVVEIDPPTFDVSVFPAEESVFGTEIESTARFEMVALVIEAFCEKRFVLVAFVRVALPAFRFWVFVVVATMLARLAVPVAVMLVPVALSKKRLEM